MATSKGGKVDISLLRDIDKLDELENLLKKKTIRKNDLERYRLFRNASGLLGRYFKNRNGTLVFGNTFDGFSSIDVSEIASLMTTGLTPFQLMTLRESARNYYEVAIKNQPKVNGIFNVERKQYVVQEDPEFEQYAKQIWRNARVVEIPTTYLNRKYKNVTEEMYANYEKNLSAPELSVEQFTLSKEEQEEEDRREEAIQSYKKELEREVKDFYPDIDELITLVNGSGASLLLHPTFAIVAYNSARSNFIFLKSVNVMWDPIHLSEKDFKNAVNTPFCNQVYKVIDYLSGKMFKTDIRKALESISLSDTGVLSEERVKNVSRFIYSGGMIDDGSLKKEVEYYAKQIK